MNIIVIVRKIDGAMVATQSVFEKTGNSYTRDPRLSVHFRDRGDAHKCVELLNRMVGSDAYAMQYENDDGTEILPEDIENSAII